jgi:hypothetical protein
MKTLAALLLLASAAFAEDIPLANGTTIKGTVARFSPATLQVVGADGKPVSIPWTGLSQKWRAERLGTSPEGKELAALLKENERLAGALETALESDKRNTLARDNAMDALNEIGKKKGEREKIVDAQTALIAAQKEVIEGLMKSAPPAEREYYEKMKAIAEGKNLGSK